MRVNNISIIIHKLDLKEGLIHDYIHKKNHSVSLKDVLNVFDLEYLGVEKDFLNKNHYYYLERRGIWIYLQKKKNSKEFILEKSIVIEHTICQKKSIEYLQMYLKIGLRNTTK